jgi:hypothetical protein
VKVIGWLLVGATAVAALLTGLDGVIAAVAAVGAVVAVLALFAAFSRPAPEPSARRREEDEAPADDTAPPAFTSRRFTTLVLGAIVIHLFAVGLLNLTNLNRALAPDSHGFRWCGVFIAESWSDPSYDATWHAEGRPRTEMCPSYKARSFYQHLNGVIEWLIGIETYTHVITGLMNTFIGLLAAWIFGKIAGRLYGPHAQQKTFLYIAYFPSLIVWTSINLRESWSFLLLAGAVYLGMKLRERFNLRDLLLFAACVICMQFIRNYLVALIALGTLLSFVAVRIRQVPAAIVTAGVIFLIITSLASRFGFTAQELDLQSQLELANAMHRGLAYGGSAFGVDADISTPMGALLYLPRGLSMFLLGPFPWSVDSWREMLALPETIVWYFLLFAAVRQIIYGVKHHLAKIALPLSLTVVICLAYGLVEGNVGTAYRHRAHAVLILLVFAAGDAARRARDRTRKIETPGPAVVLNETPC